MRSRLPPDPAGPSKDMPGQPSDYPEPLYLEDFPLGKFCCFLLYQFMLVFILSVSHKGLTH